MGNKIRLKLNSSTGETRGLLRFASDKLIKELANKLEGFKYTASKIFNPKRNKALDLLKKYVDNGGRFSDASMNQEFDKVKDHLPKSIQKLYEEYVQSTNPLINEMYGRNHLRA